MYLFFDIFFFIEPSNFWAIVKLESKDSSGVTYVGHSIYIFHEFLVVSFDAQGSFAGKLFVFIHLTLCLKERIHSNFFFLIEHLITQMIFLSFDNTDSI